MSLNANFSSKVDQYFIKELNRNFKEIEAFMRSANFGQNIDKKINEMWMEIQDEIRAIIVPEMSPLEVTMQVQNAKTDSKGTIHKTLNERMIAEVAYMRGEEDQRYFKQVETKRGLLFTDYLQNSSIKRKKNIFCLGDSVTLGSYAKKNFGNYLAEATGAKVTNYAVSGVTLSDKGDHNIYRQALKVKGADLVIVQTSDDDWLANIPIGSDQRNVKEVYGAFVTIIKLLRKTNPGAQILAMTPTKQLPVDSNGVYRRSDRTKNKLGYTLGNYTEKIILACSPLQIPIVNTFHWEVLDPYNPAFRKAYMKDGLHPNEYGHELIYHKILETYYRYFDVK